MSVRARAHFGTRPLASLAAVLFALLPVARARAQYVAPYVVLQGTLTTANGTPAKNATLTLEPSQAFFVAGTETVVDEAQCSTDSNGQVVGLPNPLVGARVSALNVGSLPVGNYYVRFAWYDQWGNQTLPSPEVAYQLTQVGELQILPPVGEGPTTATGMRIYIGTASGAETLQASTSDTTSAYTQATALTTGVAPAIRNSTACHVVANDAGWPTGTGYRASLLDANGNALANLTELLQFVGPGSTYNLSNGLPYYHGQVTYPVPLLTIPYNHNLQSISSSLTFNGFNVLDVGMLGVGTSVPAWGVDVEGTGIAGMVSASAGYLVNGNGGTSGQCLASDGVAFDTPVTCLSSAYYQAVYNGVHTSTVLTQRDVLSFGNDGAPTGLLAADKTQTVTTPAQTRVYLQTLNGTSASPMADLTTDPYAVVTATGGTATHLAVWDSTGAGLADGGVSPAATSSALTAGYLILQANPVPIYIEWGVTSTFDTGPQTVTFPHAFPHTALNVQLTDCSDTSVCSGSSTTSRIWLADTLTATTFQARNDGTGAAWFYAVGW